jgi:hypothetical protein
MSRRGSREWPAAACAGSARAGSRSGRSSSRWPCESECRVSFLLPGPRSGTEPSRGHSRRGLHRHEACIRSRPHRLGRSDRCSIRCPTNGAHRAIRYTTARAPQEFLLRRLRGTLINKLGSFILPYLSLVPKRAFHVSGISQPGSRSAQRRQRESASRGVPASPCARQGRRWWRSRRPRQVRSSPLASKGTYDWWRAAGVTEVRVLEYDAAEAVGPGRLLSHHSRARAGVQLSAVAHSARRAASHSAEGGRW